MTRDFGANVGSALAWAADRFRACFVRVGRCRVRERESCKIRDTGGRGRGNAQADLDAALEVREGSFRVGDD